MNCKKLTRTATNYIAVLGCTIKHLQTGVILSDPNHLLYNYYNIICIDRLAYLAARFIPLSPNLPGTANTA